MPADRTMRRPRPQCDSLVRHEVSLCARSWRWPTPTRYPGPTRSEPVRASVTPSRAGIIRTPHPDYLSAWRRETMSSTNEVILRAKKFGSHNYAPFDLVITRGEGAHVWDPEGREYLDLLGGYSA